MLVLAVTSPLWFLPVKYIRPKWIEYEKLRLCRRQEIPLVEGKAVNWLLRGTFMFGGIMWIAMSVAPQAIRRFRGDEINWSAIGIQLPIWLLAGFIWGVVMHFWMNKKGKMRST